MCRKRRPSRLALPLLFVLQHLNLRVLPHSLKVDVKCCDYEPIEKMEYLKTKKTKTKTKKQIKQFH